MKLCFWLLFVLGYCQASAQTAIQTSFETTDGFAIGNLHNQQGWTVTTGSAAVTGSTYKTGSQAIQLSANNTALRVDKVAYSGNVPGIRGDVYADMWVMPVTFVNRGLTINGYDLYGGSQKRLFVVEFTADNKIKAYNGSSGSNIGTWTANQWVRVSVKLDFNAEQYLVAINGVVHATPFNLRESYVPTASGTRPATIKEFHSLRFNHSSDTQVATTDATVDDIYIGTTPISDVSFGASSNERTITVSQPSIGNITLNPASGPYMLGQMVTATLTIPQGYTNMGWTGDLSGSELVKTFSVSGNMTIGANVGIDAGNPPPLHTITVQQPANGIITLSPVAAGNTYYKHTTVTATITFEACYQFNGWTGDLSGTQLSHSFSLLDDMTIGADIVMNTTPSAKRVVTTVSEFKNALNTMNPGDTIEVADGNYNLGSTTVNRSGCEIKPVIIQAANTGMAILSGSTALTFRKVKYITLKGFAFQSTGISTGIKLEDCSKMRITQNHFAINETSSCSWIYMGDTWGSTNPLMSGYNRIDHNIFEGKSYPGNYIKIDGNATQQSQYDTIDHNHFKNNTPRAANEKESIRVGYSGISMSSGFTLIERNLFEECDGDPEIISVKSCDNTIRHNTFFRSLGTLSLRHGHRNVVEGNYFFGDGKTVDGSGCGGVRVYGKDHKIINNYFHGLTGEKWDAAITITNGDVTNSSTSLSSHFLPENVLVAFNTLYNNRSNIEIGLDNNGNYNRAPINCSIVNNIVVDTLNPIIKSYSSTSLAGVKFYNNMMYPTGTSSIGVSITPAEIMVTDPMLVRYACIEPVTDCQLTLAYQVYRIASSSPAIDAAIGTYPEAVTDFEGHVRTGAFDIGADEFATGPITISALEPSHVGPNAIAYHYTYNNSSPLPVKLLSFTAGLSGRTAQLQWVTTEEVNVKQYHVEWSVNGTAFTSIATVAAKNLAGADYNFKHHEPLTGQNFYRLRIEDKDGSVIYSTVQRVFVSTVPVKVFPNPASSVLYVDVPVSIVGEARILNAAGTVVNKEARLHTGVNSIDISHLPAGVYWLQIVQPTHSSSHAFTITK